MKWDDLIGIPFKRGGRDKSGMDCYGLVCECCRRAGTPLADPLAGTEEAALADDTERLKINAREAEGPAVGRVAYVEPGGRAHVGYIVARGQVLHALRGKASRVSPLAAFRNARFYEVLPRGGEGVLPHEGESDEGGTA